MDKEGIVRQMERNSALSHCRAPREQWERASRHKIPAFKSKHPRGSAGVAHSPGSGTSRGAAPRRSIPQHPRRSGSEPGIFQLRQKNKKGRREERKKKKKTRHGSYLFSQAAAGEYSLTYFFSSPPFILTYFGAAEAAGALPSAPHSRRSPPSTPHLGIKPRQKHRPPSSAQSGGRAPQKAPDPPSSHHPQLQ